jgi:hypothetical protein
MSSPFAEFIRKFELLDEELRLLDDDFEDLSYEYAKAVKDYEDAKAPVVLTVDGTVMEKEAKIAMATSEERWQVLVKKHLLEVHKTRTNILSTRVSLVQSASSLVKAEISLSGHYT